MSATRSSSSSTRAYLAIIESSCGPPNAASRARLLEIVASARPDGEWNTADDLASDDPRNLL